MWEWLPFAVPGILNLLFGQGGLFGSKTNQATATQESETTQANPPHPMYPQLSTLLAEMMLKNWGRLQGAGFPGGTGLDLGGKMDDIFSMIENSWQGLFAETDEQKKYRENEEKKRLLGGEKGVKQRGGGR